MYKEDVSSSRAEGSREGQQMKLRERIRARAQSWSVMIREGTWKR